MKKQPINYSKFQLVPVTAPQSALQAMENLMVFDARCLDKETRRELLCLVPGLTQIRRAWKAHFAMYGCVCCHRKKVGYASGGFCDRCSTRISHRMRTCFRKVEAGRNIAKEIAAITRNADAARTLFS